MVVRQTQQWLAYELHDGLLQWIIGARLQLSAALSRDAGTPENLQGNLRRAQASLEIALDEGRALIGYLELQTSPTETKLSTRLVNFAQAVEQDAKQRGQTIVTRIEPDLGKELGDRLTDTVSWNILRIAQQALRNAIQHAGPTQIVVDCHVEVESQELVMIVEDSGLGFDARRPPTESNHFGLNSMAHRARLIGARLEVHSSAGEGCRVQCALPLRSLGFQPE